VEIFGPVDFYGASDSTLTRLTEPLGAEAAAGKRDFCHAQSQFGFANCGIFSLCLAGHADYSQSQPALRGGIFNMDASHSESPQSITERLESSTKELQQLEMLVKSGDLDSRVLNEFRNAVDHIRSTTWAVQRWLGLSHESGGDPFSVLPILAEERVRRATQIAKDLALDLQAADVGIETKGIGELLRAVEDLRERLTAILKRAN